MIHINQNFISEIENLYLIQELNSRINPNLDYSDIFYEWYEISEFDPLYNSHIFEKVVERNISFARTKSLLDINLSYAGFAYQTKGFDYHADAVWPVNQDDRAMGMPSKDGKTFINYQGEWAPNYVPLRKFTTVLYLNDDFEGGETHFPTLDILIKPERNKIIGFGCDERYIHGVMPTTQGIRSAFICWFE